MPGFVSRPPRSDQAPPPPKPAELVENDGWWPDVDLARLREAVRLETTITTARLRDAVAVAMLDLARQLAAWRAAREAGAENLHAVPETVRVDGRSRLVVLWERGLYSTVAADLGERLLSQSATELGVDRAKKLEAEVCEHRRNARWAVSDLTGAPRITVELI